MGAFWGIEDVSAAIASDSISPGCASVDDFWIVHIPSVPQICGLQGRAFRLTSIYGPDGQEGCDSDHSGDGPHSGWNSGRDLHYFDRGEADLADHEGSVVKTDRELERKLRMAVGPFRCRDCWEEGNPSQPIPIDMRWEHRRCHFHTIKAHEREQERQLQ